MNYLKLLKRPVIISFLSGLILSIPWYESGTGIVLLFALVPILYLTEVSIQKKKEKLFGSFGFFFILFLTWAASSGWWLGNATIPGSIFLIILDALLYSIIIVLYRTIRIRFGKFWGYFALVSLWMGFEYLYLNAELSVPWINLGNGLSQNIRLIQWYEYTGTFGGTLWVLLSNIFLYELIFSASGREKRKPQYIAFSAILIIPVVISLIIFYSYNEEGKEINVITVQPNVDPYEKFVSFTPSQQADTLVKLFQPLLNDSIDYVITPETAITSYTDLFHLNTDPEIRTMAMFLNDYPDLSIILGMTTLRKYYSGESVPVTARKSKYGMYYDTFNSAMQVNNCIPQYYHKSKLFPGVEAMPYANSLKFLHKLMIRLGGTFRSHGISKERTNLISCDSSVQAAPVICWELIYGEFVTGFVKNGANVIFNITNEGWWGNTPGHKMFMKYARVRAIENRRDIVRSANTGISAFINSRGEVGKKLVWDEKGAINGTAVLNDKITFYSRYGDYLGRWFKIAAIMSLLLFFYGLLFVKTEKDIDDGTSEQISS